MNPNDVPGNWPAFPNSANETQGMDLRHWLAGQALAGLCANPEIDPSAITAMAVGLAEQVADAWRRLTRPSLPISTDAGQAMEGHCGGRAMTTSDLNTTCPDCGCRVRDHNAVNHTAYDPPTVTAHCGHCGTCWKTKDHPEYVELVRRYLTEGKS